VRGTEAARPITPKNEQMVEKCIMSWLADLRNDGCGILARKNKERIVAWTWEENATLTR
jgi:hypothetical protein